MKRDLQLVDSAYLPRRRYNCPLSFSPYLALPSLSDFLGVMRHLGTLTISSSLGLNRVLRTHVLDAGSSSLSVSLVFVLLLSSMLEFPFHLRFSIGHYAPKWPWHQLIGADIVHPNWTYLISNSQWVSETSILLMNEHAKKFCLIFIKV